MVKIQNKLAYTFMAIGVLVGIAIGINAYGGSNPVVVGHSAGELDLSSGVNGNAVFNGNVGIGSPNPFNKLEVDGNVVVAGDIQGGGDIAIPGAISAISATIGGGSVWTDANDGAGSSMDADLLDGHDSFYFESLQNTNAESIQGKEVYWEGENLCYGDSCVINSGLTCTKTGGSSYQGAPGGTCKGPICAGVCKDVVACDGDKSVDCVGGEDVYFTSGMCIGANCDVGGECGCTCSVSGVTYDSETINGKKCVTFITTP